ncbi:hypothetical protein HPP92_010234 [Vanilla planifolia]|uniref:Calmodulin-binding domain-containing protein n=1 Tax=Vanilla planifolia TaxID=51239 RepID=A0A835QYK1_VANPL|nr:hypothetical protein HPP92_010234 [Vanilla planifolia]
MAARKPNSSLRDRGLSPSSSPVHRSLATPPPSSRPSPRTPLSGGTEVTTMAKKSVPNYLKPKASPPPEPPARRTSSISSVTTNSSSKTSSATRPSNKPPSPVPISQTQRAQSLITRPAKPASLTPKSSNFSKQNGDKSASRTTMNTRNSSNAKAKSTELTPIQKREATATLASPSSPKMLSSDHVGFMNVEIPMQEHLPSSPEKVEESEPISGWVVKENDQEEQKGCELVLCGENSKLQVFDEVIKEAAVIEKDPNESRLVVSASLVEQGEKEKAQKVPEIKVERVVVRGMKPEARKLRVSAAAPTVVATTPGNRKDAPRSNDVIEETKSKLMETRKNRVLALVGAFETVISLQEPEGQASQKGCSGPNGQQVQQVEQSRGNQHDQPRGESLNGQQVENSDAFHRMEEGKDNGQSAFVEDDENKPPEEILQHVGGGVEANHDEQSEENGEQVEGGEVVHQDQQTLENGLLEKDNDDGAVIVLKEEETDVAPEIAKPGQEEVEEESEQKRIANLVFDDTNVDLSLARALEVIGEN